MLAYLEGSGELYLGLALPTGSVRDRAGGKLSDRFLSVSVPPRDLSRLGMAEGVISWSNLAPCTALICSSMLAISLSSLSFLSSTMSSSE